VDHLFGGRFAVAGRNPDAAARERLDEPARYTLRRERHQRSAAQAGEHFEIGRLRRADEIGAMRALAC
jgi:hypothetical protein